MAKGLKNLTELVEYMVGDFSGGLGRMTTATARNLGYFESGGKRYQIQVKLVREGDSDEMDTAITTIDELTLKEKAIPPRAKARGILATKL